MIELDSPFPNSIHTEKKSFAAKLLLKSVIYSFAIFGILFILLLLVVLAMLRQETGPIITVPDKAILSVNFDNNYNETRSDDILSELGAAPSMTFLDLIKNINLAATDKKVLVLAAEVSQTGMGIAQVQDLRKAIANFRSTGKKAYMYSTGFGSFGQGTKEYYLATAFDEVWMQPNTEVGITGISIEVPFLRKILDKIGVTPEFYSRYEYKTAMASMTDYKMSAQYKSEIKKLGSSIFNQFIVDCAKARGISEVELKKLVNRAPLMAEEALKNKLIDRVAYRQDFNDELKNMTKGKVISINDYANSIYSYKKGVSAIAFMVIDGVIADGESYSNALRDESVTGSMSVLQQLDAIAKDGDVKALIIRVNSPGGSYDASNEIWYAIKRFKETKKIPVIISMSNYAASGGYFVALAGDYIWAEPSTITGSIGVLGGKFVVEKLWTKLGVEWSGVVFGDNAGILSPNHKFSKNEKDIFNKSLDTVYKDFTLKVSESRKLDLAKIDQLARGRIWTGSQALKVGLVDGIGGIDSALGKAQELAGIKATDKFRIAFYPQPKTLQEKVQQLIGGSKGIYVKKIVNDFGLDIQELNMLKRLQYDTIMAPMSIRM